MAKATLLTDENNIVRLWFWCPGCDEPHAPVVAAPEGADTPVWQWNGDLEKPTVSPSLLVAPNWPAARCHSFLKEGKLEFLSDCHHALAGRTVDLPPDIGDDDDTVNWEE